MNKKIKVFIVDDSALIRKILSTQLAKYENIEVIGTAENPYEARDRIVINPPDVLILDIEMPKMDGLTFLSKIMQNFPLPVIIVSSLSKKGSAVAIRSFELGAIDVMAKPGGSFSIVDMLDELVNKIVDASYVSKTSLMKKSEKLRAMPKAYSTNAIFKTTDKIIAIGSSTGGTEAVKFILSSLPRESPPIIVTQHMPAKFTESWAERMDSLSKISVKEAKNGDEVTAGKALIAPGGYHMVLKRNGARYYVELNEEPQVHHQRPAVDVMFKSVAECAGSNAIGVILTGMGRDGATGLKQMKDSGAYTIAQDEQSCVVFGMPKVAIQEGAAMKVESLDRIPELLVELVNKDK